MATQVDDDPPPARAAVPQGQQTGDQDSFFSLPRVGPSVPRRYPPNTGTGVDYLVGPISDPPSGVPQAETRSTSPSPGGGVNGGRGGNTASRSRMTEADQPHSSRRQERREAGLSESGNQSNRGGGATQAANTLPEWDSPCWDGRGGGRDFCLCAACQRRKRRRTC